MVLSIIECIRLFVHYLVESILNVEKKEEIFGIVLFKKLMI